MKDLRRICLAFLIVCAAEIMGHAQDRPASSWTPGTIAEWQDRYYPELASLAGFASRPNPGGDSPEAMRERHARVCALKVLCAMQPSMGARELALNGLDFYYQKQAADEGRYVLTDWPAADTLVNMGSLACPALFDRLELECDELNIRLVAQVLVHIDGRELAASRLKIKRREHLRLIEEPPEDDHFVSNLTRVLKILEDPEYSTAKYSPTAWYKANRK